MTIKLNRPIASNGKADEEEVHLIKRSLNWLGYYTPYEKLGLTTVPDRDVFRAIKDFQKDQGLPVTGEIRPDDKTIEALNKSISKQLQGSSNGAK